MSNVVELVSSKSEADLAAEVKERMTNKLKDLCNVMDDAKALGFEPEFCLDINFDGNFVIHKLTISKHY